ncbi:MAG TPA: GntR family transcriptional regulator [Nitrobacter sp.]|nr:GntR family transcriptional regulator [Nitrobacter sp.]
MKAIAPEHDGRHDIAARLRELITGGRFMPNERLIEADLASLLGTNRANVRMALAMLDQEGLVTRERNRGARVRLVSDAEAIEIAEARRSLESLVAGQAALRVSKADRVALRKIIAAMRKAHASGDFLLISQLNAALHAEIQRIAGNATVARLLETLKSQIVRQQYRAILLPGRARNSVQEHAAIVTAICEGNERAAAKAMHRHIDGVIAALKRAIAHKGETV